VSIKSLLCNVTAADVDELSLAVELSADSDDVSDDVVPRSRGLTRGASRDLDHVIDGRCGYRSSQRGALPSNNIQLVLTSADDDSDDGESYRRVVVICIHNLSTLHSEGRLCRLLKRNVTACTE